MNLAPNGKKSNLTNEQYKLVRTPKFKKWFGNWENSPETSSKVVDANGEPMVLYRGNREQIGYEFTLGHNLLKKPTINNFGHFFTPDIWVAKRYAEDFMQTNKGYILEVFLNAKNILDLTELGHNSLGEQFVDYLESKKLKFGDYEELINEVRKYEGNYDEIDKKYYSPTIYAFFDYYPKLRDFFIDNNINGIKFLERSRGGGLTYVVFQSTQIKLADGTNTTFDANNPDIRYKNGGNMETEYKVMFESRSGSGNVREVRVMAKNFNDAKKKGWIKSGLNKKFYAFLTAHEIKALGGIMAMQVLSTGYTLHNNVKRFNYTIGGL